MTHIFQVGAGSGGIVVLDLLTRDPRITAITLVEPDIYKPHNVHRHIFPNSAVGCMKADLAKAWVRERRPDMAIELLKVDITDPAMQSTFEQRIAACDIGICAVDNETAKYAFDALMRHARKPWTLGEVLSGGIGGWVHRFTPDGPCYGCVASHLQRTVTEESAQPPPDYANPGAAVVETTIPASKASIEVIAGLHASLTLDLLTTGVASAPRETTSGVASASRETTSGVASTSRENTSDVASAPREPTDFTSLLFTLQRVPGVFDEVYRTYRFRIPKSACCLICSAIPVNATGEALDVALDQALARLGKD